MSVCSLRWRFHAEPTALQKVVGRYYNPNHGDWKPHVVVQAFCIQSPTGCVQAPAMPLPAGLLFWNPLLTTA